jgi:hypothetical protein
LQSTRFKNVGREGHRNITVSQWKQIGWDYDGCGHEGIDLFT